MGFNKRKMEDARKTKADKEAAARLSIAFLEVRSPPIFRFRLPPSTNPPSISRRLKRAV